MTKIRTVKPEFFRHEGLFEAEQHYQLPIRLSFAGLFACCDREGRFRWKPRQLKLDILPFDNVDFDAVLNALHQRNFIVKYEKDGEYYGCIPSWHRHQTINAREPTSKLPDPNQCVHMRAHANQEPVQVMHMQTSAPPELSQTKQVHTHLEVEKEMEGKGNGSGVCTEVQKGQRSHETSLLPMQSVITIPLNDKTEFPICQNQIDEWQEIYSPVNVLETLKLVREWNIINVKKRKTKSGILRHITGWLANEKNRGGIRAPPANSSALARNNALQNHNLNLAEQWLNQQEPKIVEGEIFMIPEDKPQFVTLIARTAEFYNKALSSVSFEIYWQLLNRYTFAALENAVKKHMADGNHGRFMPLPADIIAQLECGLNVLIAWSRVCYAIRVIGSYRSIVFDDPLIHNVITDMSGWIEFCNISNKQLPFSQKEFERRYQHYLWCPTQEYVSVLIGRIDHQNLCLGYPPETPCFLGNEELALQVYLHGVQPKALPRFRMGTLNVSKLLVDSSKPSALPHKTMQEPTYFSIPSYHLSPEKK